VPAATSMPMFFFIHERTRTASDGVPRSTATANSRSTHRAAREVSRDAIEQEGLGSKRPRAPPAGAQQHAVEDDWVVGHVALPYRHGRRRDRTLAPDAPSRKACARRCALD